MRRRHDVAAEDRKRVAEGGVLDQIVDAPGGRLSRRTFLGGSVGLAAAALAAGCGGSTAGGGGGGKVTLRLQNWFTETDMSAWNIGLKMVKDKLPNVSVKLEFVPYADTANKTLTQAAARNVPDLIMASNEHTPSLSANGVLLNLDPYIKGDKNIKPDDFAPGVAQGFHLRGHWWGFPYDVSTFAIYYNRDLFDRAGIKAPPSSGNPWTWDEFVAAAKELTKPSAKQWGVTWWTGQGTSVAWDQYRNSNFIYGAGGRNFDDQLRHCIIDSPEAASGIQFLVDLIHKYQVAPLPAQTAGGGVDYFQSGFAAMYIDGSFSLGSRIKTANFPFDVVYLPVGKQNRLVTGGSGFCISAGTKHKDECWQWLKEFTSPEVLGAMIGRTGRGIPARKSVAHTFADQFSQVRNARVFSDELSHTFNDRSVLAYNEFIDSYKRELEPIFSSGSGSIQQALGRVAKTTNQVMDQKWQAVKGASNGG